MRNPLIAIVLCIFAAAANAHSVARADSAPVAAGSGAVVVKAVVIEPQAREATSAIAPNAEHDLIPPDGPAAPRAAAGGATLGKDAKEKPDRGGPAMLLAVVAVMSGIALRRYVSGIR